MEWKWPPFICILDQDNLTGVRRKAFMHMSVTCYSNKICANCRMLTALRWYFSYFSDNPIIMVIFCQKRDIRDEIYQVMTKVPVLF